MYFKDKTIWITGASSGIGKALATAFAREKARLVLSSLSEAELLPVQQECLKHTDFCYLSVFDLSDQEDVCKASSKALQEVGKIDILINNGGISQRSLAMDTPLSLDRKIFEINFFGGVALTKTVLPSMVANGGGQVIAVSSITGKFGFPLRSAYAASKHAVLGFYESVRTELQQQGISVTILIPGRIQTNISINSLVSDGSSYGKMDDGQADGMPVEDCARIMLKAIRKKRREKLVGGKELLMVHIKRFLPRLFYKLVSKIKPT